MKEDPERFERGLRIVRRELVLDAGGAGLGGAGLGASGIGSGTATSLGSAAARSIANVGLVVDALAADAVGAPVLMFLALLDRDRQLPSRIADAREWFSRNGSMLAPILDGSGVRVDLPARVFVIGFEFSDVCLQRLRRESAVASGDAGGDLQVFRVEGLFVDGIRHLGVARVLGGIGELELGSAPEEPIATRCRRLAGLLDQLDPDLAVDGDRYSRVWRLDGTTVIRVERDSRRLYAVVPEFDVIELGSDDDVVEACDLAMQRYLAILRGEHVEATETAGVDVPGADVSGVSVSGVSVTGVSVTSARSAPGPDPGRAGAPQSRAPLSGGRSGASEAEVTAEEFDAFLDDDAVGRRS